jgi:hypothetical protein
MLPISGGGRFKISASCDSGIINFAFEYISDRGGKSALAWQESDTYTRTTFGFSTQIVHNVDRWVNLRIRLGDAPPLARESSSKYENEAEIVFYNPDELLRLVKSHGQTGDENNNSKAIEPILAAERLVILPSTSGGTIQQFFASEHIRVEIPLADGREPVLEINSTDQSLRSFIGSCRGMEASVPMSFSPGRSVSVEGTYANGRGAVLVLSNGVASFSSHGQKQPSLPYSVNGSTITVIDPNQQPHRLEVQADGSIYSPESPDYPRMTRVK